jgi:hypothetical protein
MNQVTDIVRNRDPQDHYLQAAGQRVRSPANHYNVVGWVKRDLDISPPKLASGKPTCLLRSQETSRHTATGEEILSLPVLESIPTKLGISSGEQIREDLLCEANRATPYAQSLLGSSPAPAARTLQAYALTLPKVVLVTARLLTTV